MLGVRFFVSSRVDLSPRIGVDMIAGAGSSLMKKWSGREDFAIQTRADPG